MVSRERHEGVGQFRLDGADEVPRAAIGVPEMAEDLAAKAPGGIKARPRGDFLHRETLAVDVDLVGRMIAGREDDIEAGCVIGDLAKGKGKEVLVVDTPVLALGIADVATSEHLVEALRGAELADMLPAQVSRIEHTRVVAQSLEDCGW